MTFHSDATQKRKKHTKITAKETRVGREGNTMKERNTQTKDALVLGVELAGLFGRQSELLLRQDLEPGLATNKTDQQRDRQTNKQTHR